MQYSVMQVILREKFFGTESGNLSELEKVLNREAAKGWKLHTISTTSGGSKGLGGGDRIQATIVFEKEDSAAMAQGSTLPPPPTG
jgi:hypothetical protein